MTIIKGSTKRGQNLIDGARFNKGEKLREVYSSWSKAKEEAYEHCKARQAFFKGYNFRITGSNCNFFSVAFEGEMEYVNPVTGEVTVEEVLVVETYCNEYVVLLNM